MFEAKSSSENRWARVRPLFGLLVPLCLAPLTSCANDTYLAQNYSTANPAYSQPGYAAPAPAVVASPTGQFLAPPQLNELVSRIALYPDDLIAIILPASTYPLQVVQATRYLEAVRGNSTLSPDDSWDNAIVALLNYPDVVNMMNQELAWTERLGQAVIMQQSDVITAIGQFRSQVQAVGNLRTDERQIVEYQQGAISIRPANPQIIYVPQYQPAQVTVYSSQPVFGYYPRPCPVYYYDYSSGYPSGFTNFWGVSTMFSIGWSSSRLRLYDYDFYDDPRFDRPYNGFFYRRGHDHHDYDDGPTWGGRDGDGYDARHGGTTRPREHDWQPRPVAVGGRPMPQTAPPLAEPTRTVRDGNRRTTQPTVAEPTQTIRDGSRRTTQMPSGASGAGAGIPAAPRGQTIERTRNFSPSSGELGVRRGVTVIPSQAPESTQRFERGRSFSPPSDLQGPSAIEPSNAGRFRSFESTPRAVTPMPSEPSLHMRSAPPQRIERDAISRPRYVPSQSAPERSMRSVDDGRSSSRMAPSRPEPRMVAPSRPAPRMSAPSRPEPRAVAPRASDGATSSRRGDDNGGGRGPRER